LAAQQEVEQQEEEEAQAAVVSVVETDSGGQEVIHEVHFHMEVEGEGQEQQVCGDLDAFQYCKMSYSSPLTLVNLCDLKSQHR
jgi:hypothetical protein